jgi:hypothetical protein
MTSMEFKPEKGSIYTYNELKELNFKFIKETSCVIFFRKDEILLTFNVDYYKRYDKYKLSCIIMD